MKTTARKPLRSEVESKLTGNIKVNDYRRDKWTGQLYVGLVGDKEEITSLIKGNDWQAEIIDASLFDNQIIIARVAVRAEL